MHMTLRCLFSALLAIVLLLPVVAAPNRSLGRTTSVVNAYRARLEHAPEQIPAITQIAEAVVAHQIANPRMIIHYPWPYQLAFSDEFIARSGALGNWAGFFETDMIPGPDLMIYGVRSWETDTEEAVYVLSQCSALGWKTILIASSQGMPSGLPYDYFIDNFAPSGSNDDGAVNMMMNCTLGWLWQDEYVAACTRELGAHPGILMSSWYPEAEEFDNAIMSDPTRLYPTDAVIPAGQLSEAYLDRVNWLVDQVEGNVIQDQISSAADIIAERLRNGGRVGVSTLGHASPFEVFIDLKSPFTPFHAGGGPQTAFQDALDPGDLLVWISYIGVGTATRYYYDYDFYIRESGVDFITCFTPDTTDPANNGPGALAHIDQSWPIGDAEVAIPFAPNKMSPMSAINQLLIFRTLDEAVATRLYPLTSVTLTINPLTALTSDNITLTATPTGGVNPEYQFWVRVPGSAAKSLLRDYSTTNTCSLIPSVTGTYTLLVYAREHGSAAAYQVYQAVGYAVKAPPLTAVALAEYPVSPAVTSDNITITATPTGGLNPEYQFWVRVPGSAAKSLLRDYSTTSTCSLIPSVTGTYTLLVYAREHGSAAAYQVYQAVGYLVKAPPLTAVALSEDPVSPAVMGNNITITATPTGGLNPEYQFWVRVPGSAAKSLLRGYNTANTCSLIPSVTGTYTLLVYAREHGSAAAYQVYSAVSYVVKAP